MIIKHGSMCNGEYRVMTRNRSIKRKTVTKEKPVSQWNQNELIEKLRPRWPIQEDKRPTLTGPTGRRTINKAAEPQKSSVHVVFGNAGRTTGNQRLVVQALNLASNISDSFGN